MNENNKNLPNKDKMNNGRKKALENVRIEKTKK
jgi:hypothetical protein